MILEKFEALQHFLTTPKNVVIVGHLNPDGDALGSSLGLKHHLCKKGHTATVIMPNEFPTFLDWMPGAKEIYLFKKQQKAAEEVINKSDIIFLLDFNALHRTGETMQKTLESYPNSFAMIDHHQQPEEIATYRYADTRMSSACEMVYHFITMMDDANLIDAPTATCLYTGIMTDTGSFRFRATTAITHRVIASLIDKGAENDKIHHHIYDNNSYDRLRLLGQALQNLQILPEYKTAFITLNEAEKKRFHFQKGDTEGVVNYALSVKGIVFGVLFIEDKINKIIKISFRSKGRFSVNKFSRDYFNGGGHDNAAGGKSELSMEDTLKKFTALLPTYAQALENAYEN